MNITPSEKIINGFIARKPELAVDFLKSQGVPLSSEPTLNEITARLYERYYQNDKTFNKALGEVIAYGDNIGFVITASLIVGIIATGVSGGVAASKFNKDKRIAENQAQVAKNAAQHQTEAQKQAARDEAVASSVATYKSELEAQSTQRRKSAIIFVAGIAVLGMVAALIFRK